MSETSRRMWELMEPYHAVTYFAPESQQVCEALGAKGFWMSYFALRAAPLGPVPAEVVVATFYNFHPRKVAHAVPAAWEAASPADYLRAHVAALLSGGLDPCEALVIFAADGKVTAERVRTSRSWTEAEWDSATTRLRDRGLLDDSDTLTPDGHALRAWVEDRTDRASQRPWNILGTNGTERLAELIHPLTRTIANSNAFAEDNPMGLPKPA
jgi:hypothetical protein